MDDICEEIGCSFKQIIASIQELEKNKLIFKKNIMEKY